MTDPIADMLIRIKNALLAQHEEVKIPHSKIKEAIAQILVDNNYLESLKVEKQSPQSVLVLKLGYHGKLSKINGVRRVSRPGRRLYATADHIPTALNGYGLTIVSTSKGVLTDKDARKQNVGGELLCQVW